ncbi:MAG: hypothetical protein WCB68_16490 [Pyrinomonadaceae bacterium]
MITIQDQGSANLLGGAFGLLREHFNLDGKLSRTGDDKPEVADTTQPFAALSSSTASTLEPSRELSMWLRALRSFFHVGNHPATDKDRENFFKRDWTDEVRITRRALQQSSQLALRIIAAQKSDAPLLVEAETVNALNISADIEAQAESSAATDDTQLVALTEILSDAGGLCDALLESPNVSFHAWASIGKILARDLDRTSTAPGLERLAKHQAHASLQAPLLELTRAGIQPPALATDMLTIFGDLSLMLERLRFIESLLKSDQPLKHTLPIFTLVHEETRNLLEFIERRALRTEGLEKSVSEALDGANYAITMELRKVFSHELVGLSSARQAPPIYVKVENAHGLLRDCFQQSTVTLAQLFDPRLNGAQLFDAFQNKLQQSLTLRKDLWSTLQLIRRARQERDLYPVAPLLEHLNAFRQGGMRYLMYKDWEACERFIDEVSAARGAVELAPVLHRFDAYLETLFGQINMRTVLADYPFEAPTE